MGNELCVCMHACMHTLWHNATQEFGARRMFFHGKEHEQDFRFIPSDEEEEWRQPKNQQGNWQNRAAG